MIEYYLTTAYHYLETYAYMSMAFAFIIAFTESLPLVGTVIPSSVTMSIIGILVGRESIIALDITIFCAFLGALAGDTVGFFIGKYYNERLRITWPFKRYPRWLTLGEDFFKKHGGKSILIGRFVGPVRSSVPLIAGLLKMSWFRFFVAAIPSTILWAIVYLLPGALIGAVSLELPCGTATKFIFIGFGIIVLLWFLFWVIQRSFASLITRINNWINRLWIWLYHHYSSRFLLRLITNHRTPTDHHQLTMALLAFLSFIAFLILLIITITLGPNTSLNEPLFHFLQSLRLPNIDKFFVVITMFGDTIVVMSIGLLLVIALVFKKKWRSAFHLLAITLLSGTVFYFLKIFIYSPRPIKFLVIDRSSSFPSGHMGFSVTILGFIAFLTAQALSKKWQWIPYTLASVLIILIGYSRLYLGTHWLEDILASLFIGLTILLVVIISYRRYPSKSFGNSKWLLCLIIAVTLPWISFTKAKFHTVLRQYSPLWPTRQLNFNQWWEHPICYIPLYRMNRFGHLVQPINIQWAAGLRNVKQTLAQHGWETIRNKTNMKGVFSRFASYKPEKHFPIFPWLYRGKPPVLFMIKHLPKKTTIIELRLWRSDTVFNDSVLPLWVGSINYHISPKRLVSLRQSSEITLGNGGGINQLIHELSGYQWVRVILQSCQEPQKKYLLDWDRTILIIRAREKG